MVSFYVRCVLLQLRIELPLLCHHLRHTFLHHIFRLFPLRCASSSFDTLVLFGPFPFLAQLDLGHLFEHVVNKRSSVLINHELLVELLVDAVWIDPLHDLGD